MATKRSKAIMPRSTHSVVPMANPRNICTAQPKNEIDFLSEKKIINVEGREEVVKQMSKKERFPRKKYIGV
jgi:hypothetical protein